MKEWMGLRRAVRTLCRSPRNVLSTINRREEDTMYLLAPGHVTCLVILDFSVRAIFSSIQTTGIILSITFCG